MNKKGDKKKVMKKHTEPNAPSSGTQPGAKRGFSLAEFRVEDDGLVSQDGHRERTTIHAGKPKKALPIRTWPDLCGDCWLYTNDVTRVTHPVHPEVLEKWPSLRDECKLRRLYLAVDSEGEPFIWETPKPDPLRPNSWVTSGRKAVEAACQRWVRVVPVQQGQRYDLITPTREIPDPPRPTMTWKEGVGLAYQGRFVTLGDPSAIAHLLGRKIP
jgi:hypothetical protein